MSVSGESACRLLSFFIIEEALFPMLLAPVIGVSEYGLAGESDLSSEEGEFP